jgi:two-component system phosphate regulon sensor histidine kinase PhoR
VLLGVFTIVCIIIVQITWLIASMNSESKKFNHLVHVALFEVSKKLAGNSHVPMENPVRKISDDFYVVDLNSDVIADVLEFYLINEFNKLNIHTDFEYGIYDCTTDRIMHGNYIGIKDGRREPDSKTVLPKVAGLTYYFVIHFPNRNEFILNSISVWIFFAAVSVIVLIFFGYALYVILRQKRLAELQKDFINNMTHEFKTPLSSVKIAADYLLSREDNLADSRYKKYAEIILAQNEHLNRQIEKVLHIARNEKNSFRPNKVIVSLPELVDKIVTGNQTNLKDPGRITFINNAGEVQVAMDELHVTNAIASLIDNALKYCAREPAIEIRLELDNKQLNLIIRDNGIGIPKAELKRVFQKFYRVPTGNVHNVKGFGLGLFYVRNVCKSHGWQINLTSNIDVGTQVTIQIPMKSHER